MCARVVSHSDHILLFVAPETAACELSGHRFSGRILDGLPFPTQGIFLTQGLKLNLLLWHWQVDSFTAAPSVKPRIPSLPSFCCFPFTPKQLLDERLQLPQSRCHLVIGYSAHHLWGEWLRRKQQDFLWGPNSLEGELHKWYDIKHTVWKVLRGSSRFSSIINSALTETWLL